MIETIITSSVLILAVIVLRTVFKGRIKSTLRYGLWLIVVIRLSLPFSIAQSSVSIMNLINDPLYEEETEQAMVLPAGPELLPELSGGESYEQDDRYDHDGIVYESERPAAAYYELYPEEGKSGESGSYTEERAFSLKTVLTTVWIFGAAVMIFWFITVNCIFYAELKRSRKKLEYDVPLDVYSAGGILSPCIFGFAKPSIYIPEDAAERTDAVRFVIAHELCHYYHGDIVWSAVRYLLLSFYWFNPLVWAAAVLSKHDCEYACDEAAISRLGEDQRFEYGKAVIELIPQKRGEMFGVASTSMASSKRVLKERIKMIAAKPKNRLYAITCLTFAVIFATCGTFTSAIDNDDIQTVENTESSSETSAEVTENASADENEETAAEEEETSAVIENIPADSNEETVTEEEETSEEQEEPIQVNVTDYTGEEKTLYYADPRDHDYEAVVFMDGGSNKRTLVLGSDENTLTLNNISYNTPALMSEPYFGDMMREFIADSRFSQVNILYDSKIKTLTNWQDTEDFDKVCDAVSSLVPEYCGESVSGEPEMRVKFLRSNGGFSSVLEIELYSLNDRIVGRITADDYSEIISLIMSESQPPQEDELETAYNSSAHFVSELFYADGLYEIMQSVVGNENAAVSEKDSSAPKEKAFSVKVSLTDLRSSLYYPDIVAVMGADPEMFVITAEVKVKNLTDKKRNFDCRSLALIGGGSKLEMFRADPKKSLSIPAGQTVTADLRYLCNIEEAARIHSMMYNGSYLEEYTQFIRGDFEDIIETQSSDDVMDYYYRTFMIHGSSGYYQLSSAPTAYEMHHFRKITDGDNNYLAVTFTAYNRSDYAQLIEPGAFRFLCGRYGDDDLYPVEPLYIDTEEELMYSPDEAELMLKGIGRLYELPDFICMNLEGATEFTLVYDVKDYSRVRRFVFSGSHDDEPYYSYIDDKRIKAFDIDPGAGE